MRADEASQDLDDARGSQAAGDTETLLIVPLGGQPGLRRGEMIALEWSDIDFAKPQRCVRRSDWNGIVKYVDERHAATRSADTAVGGGVEACVHLASFTHRPIR